MNTGGLVALAIFIGALTRESVQQFTVPDKNKNCTFGKFAVCHGDNQTELNSPKRVDGKDGWKHLNISFYSYISIKLSSLQLDTLHVTHANVVKCFIDTTFTKEITVESAKQVYIEWFKTSTSTERTDIKVSNSIKVNKVSTSKVEMVKSQSVTECPGVRELKLTEVNVTFKFDCLNADSVRINGSTVTQDENSIKFNAKNSIHISNSIIDIKKELAIVAINATSIYLRNATFKTAPGASVVIFGYKIVVSDTNFHHTRGILVAIVSSVTHVIFSRNYFTNLSVDILKLSRHSWNFVDNAFTCSCHLNVVLNESLLNKEFYELNYCHFSKCKISLKAFFDTLHSSQMCNKTDELTDDDLCSKIESKQLVTLKESRLYKVFTFGFSTLVILLALSICIRMYTKCSNRESRLNTMNQTLVKVKEADLSEFKDCNLSDGSKVSTIHGADLPDIYCDLHYSPVAEDGTFDILNESKCVLPDVYSNAFDSAESENSKFEEENSRIYTDVCDVLYSAVDYSKKKKTREEKHAGASDTADINILSKVSQQFHDDMSKCTKGNDGIYSEVIYSDVNTTDIYDNLYSNTEEIEQSDSITRTSRVPEDLLQNFVNGLATYGNHDPVYYSVGSKDEIYCSIDSRHS